MKNNNVNIVIRSLSESVLGWGLLALILSHTKDITFMQALLMPYTIAMIVSAFAGACIGYRRKALKEQANV